MKNWTPDEKLLFSAGLSILGSAATGAASAGYQQWSTGAINPGVVLNVVLLAFITLLGKSLYDYVPSHITQELQMLRDLQAQLFAHPPMMPAQPQQPLVVIHTQNATPLASSTSDAASIVTLPAAAVQTLPLVGANPIANAAATYVPPPQQIMLTNPTGGSTVPVPGDILGDLPVTNGQPAQISQITGTIPVYGASGK